MSAAPSPAGRPALPEHTARLFPDHDPAALLGAGRGLLVARLLEDGDGADLRWLTATLGEAALAGGFARAAGRGLSRRSRDFWRQVLGVPAAEPAPAARAVWALA